jgi:hypothetical protein
MQIIRLGLFIFISILFSASQCHAQTLLDFGDMSSAKIDSYSDDELRAFYVKAIESGLTEAQLYKMATEKGLSDAELIKLRNRLQNITTVKKSGSTKNTEDNRLTDIRKADIQHEYDTIRKSLPYQSFENDTEIFGSELFTSNSTAFEPNLRIPTPAGYILGPDDEIILNVYGFSEKSYNLKVNEEGVVYIQNVGPIYVSGLSIEQATEKIRTKLG